MYVIRSSRTPFMIPLFCISCGVMLRTKSRAAPGRRLQPAVLGASLSTSVRTASLDPCTKTVVLFVRKAPCMWNAVREVAAAAATATKAR